MKKNIFKLSAVLIMIAFLSGFASGIATTSGNPHLSESNGVATIITDNATISVTGGNNVPFYHIQSKGSNTSYLVKFVDMEEFVDKNNDSLFQSNELVPLSTNVFPGINWNFSGFQIVNDSINNLQMVNFNFTHSSSPLISLDNHINLMAGNQIKFDIAINQYTWKSTNSSAKLAIKIQITGGNLSAVKNSNNVTFGNGFFNTVSNAQTSNGNVSVSTQIANGNSFYLVFDHFNGNFSLDPIFGVQNTSSSSSTTSSVSTTSTAPTSTTETNSSGLSSSSKTAALGLTPILLSFAVVAIVIVKKRKFC